MKKSIFALTGCIFLLTTCGGTPKQFENLSTPVTNPNQRYETERVSVLPPTGEGWSGKGDEDIISFSSGASSYKEGVRNNSILIDPFNFRLNADNLDKLLEKENLAISERAKKYGVRRTYPYYARLEYKAGMNCVVRDRYEGPTSVGGKKHKINYFCEQPNQPKDLPPIEVIFNESALPEVEFSDPDTILAPIWNSIQFKPVDRETSAAYQKWKRENAQFRENMRRNEEQERLRNEAAKP